MFKLANIIFFVNGDISCPSLSWEKTNESHVNTLLNTERLGYGDQTFNIWLIDVDNNYSNVI